MVFDSLRRPMGGFMRRPDPPAPTVIRDEALTATLLRVETLGRIIVRRLIKLEKKMADQNVTVDMLLQAVQAQKAPLASMATLLASIHARLNSALAGQISPQAQQTLNEAFAELKGNTNAISDAVQTYTPDAQDPNAPPAGGTGAGPVTGSGSTSGGPGTGGGAPQPAATTTQLTSSKPQATTADVVRLTATVDAVNPTALAITGSVTFGVQGGNDLGSAPLDSTGVAAFTMPPTAGDFDLIATYSGDANFAVSKSSVVEQSIVVPETPAPAPAPTPPAGAQGDQSGSTGAATGQAPQT